ncbi:MAG: hypothetical protein M3454_00870 [Actinomycetota bacterium]|nr:hypothetical protein [Actinomycetota bacterium]
MERRLLLASVSAAQLVSSVTGMALALKRGHNFDVGFMVGHPDKVARESILQGTAFSAPLTTLLAQATATVVLARQPSTVAVRTIGIIGGVNIPGYLSERLVRRRLSRTGWDPLETPLLVVEIALSVMMPLLAPRVTTSIR